MKKKIALSVGLIFGIALGIFLVASNTKTPPISGAIAAEPTKEISYKEKVIPAKVLQFKPYDILIRFRKDDSNLEVDLLADDGTNAKIKVPFDQLGRPSVHNPQKTVRQLIDDFATQIIKEPAQ